MDSYKIVWEKRAVKELSKLPRDMAERILTRVSDLKNNPESGKKLKGSFLHYFRLRVGAYRIIYRFEKKELIIAVLRIGHRKDIYQSL